MPPAPGAGSAAEAVADLEGLGGVGRVLSLDAHKDAGHGREALVRQDVGVELPPRELRAVRRRALAATAAEVGEQGAGERTRGQLPELDDLETGEVTLLYACSVTDNTIALYAKNDSLKVYDTDTGKLITDTAVEPVEGQQSVMMDNAGNGYVWLELRNNDSYDVTSTRVYGPEGLVSDLTHLQETYNYLGYLTTTPEGRPLYYGTSDKLSSSGSLCDVLDEAGNVVLSGLGSCYSYYSNSLNALPDHVFVARRGFYYGWMDTDGNWLYCRSIFSSVNADDELGY